MNISQALLSISQKLSNKNIDNFNLEADMLLSFVLKKPREYLFAHGEKKVYFGERVRLELLVLKRLKGYSLAVIMGEKEFYGRKFYVNKNVLVPRPETELLIDSVLDVVSNFQFPISNFQLIDIGTGSGCIIISLIKKLEIVSKFKACPRLRSGIQNSKFIAIDVSGKALRVAKKNAKKHDVYNNIEFIKSDLLTELIKRNEKIDDLIIITANLPYLSSKQIKNSPSIQKEPRLALVAGDDGLLYYKKLFKQIRNCGLFDSKKVIVFCEIDESQTEMIRKFIKEILKGVKVKIKKDFSGFERLVIMELN